MGVKEEKKKKTRQIWLNVLPDDLWFKVDLGTSVWEALEHTDVDVDSDCGGMGTCGKCKVKVISEVDPPSAEEEDLLDQVELDQGIRLACQTKINHDMVINTGQEEEEKEEYLKILTTSHVIQDMYIPLSQIDPLIDKRLVILPPDVQKDGLSDLDAIKEVLGPEYHDLKAPLSCLRKLTECLKQTAFHGTAILHDQWLVDWQSESKLDRGYGLVFDLGTSTVVGKLLSLNDGNEVGVTSCLNNQSRHGADVISRLQYIKDHPEGTRRMHRLLVGDLNTLTEHLLKTAGITKDDIFVAVAAGNTVMQHFLLNLTPIGIAEAPFSPVLSDGLIVKAADLGLKLHEAAMLYTLPMKSGYIGGDLLSVVLTSGAAEQQDEVILGLDLGTNGEIFLGNGKKMLTCSAAAGPALEGAKISSGMIAKAGAIEGVSYGDHRIQYTVIGNIKPTGLCGSGLVDLIAVLLHLGIIDDEGLICPPDKQYVKGLSSRLVKHRGVHDFLIASARESGSGKALYLTQKDVRALQLAKAAIAAGVETLMDELGIVAGDIDRVYLAGALGNYVDPLSTVRIGMIPQVNPQIIKSLGNAASQGAAMVLLAKKYWRKADHLAHFIKHVELSSRPDFNEHFIDHMYFPKDSAW
ncbi:ASKHA domain-containing protein [Chloroflexota bacterium]